jgi:hypothetical protein
MTIEHIEKSIADAVAGKSNLTPELLAIRGFSTPTLRHLYNNLCNIEGTYLEVGLFCGASFCASFNKKCTSIGIEDHSQDFSAGFEQVKKELKENLEKFADRANEMHVHFIDCFSVAKSTIPDNIDIYFFDGFHSEETQRNALPHFFDKMAKKFIWIVDDINWSYVKSGTDLAIEDLKDKMQIEQSWVLRGQYENNDPIWHNGIVIFLINKK